MLKYFTAVLLLCALGCLPVSTELSGDDEVAADEEAAPLECSDTYPDIGNVEQLNIFKELFSTIDEVSTSTETRMPDRLLLTATNAVAALHHYFTSGRQRSVTSLLETFVQGDLPALGSALDEDDLTDAENAMAIGVSPNSAFSSAGRTNWRIHMPMAAVMPENWMIIRNQEDEASYDEQYVKPNAFASLNNIKFQPLGFYLLGTNYRPYGIHHNVVMVAGDYVQESELAKYSNCLIIATGNLTFKGRVEFCTIIAKGSVLFEKSVTSSVVLAGSSIHAKIKDKEGIMSFGKGNYVAPNVDVEVEDSGARGAYREWDRQIETDASPFCSLGVINAAGEVRRTRLEAKDPDRSFYESLAQLRTELLENQRNQEHADILIEYLSDENPHLVQFVLKTMMEEYALAFEFPRTRAMVLGNQLLPSKLQMLSTSEHEGVRDLAESLIRQVERFKR